MLPSNRQNNTEKEHQIDPSKEKATILKAHLVASFHATLEEALNVDLMLHVVDGSHPDASVHMRAVEETLAGLTNREADILVLNKVDRVEDPISLQVLREDREQEIVHLSARSGEGLDLLDRRRRPSGAG